MRAVGYYESLPIENEQALIDLEIERPSPGARELLVKVEAISVNPVDTKVRRRRAGSPESPVILGWDAAGTVEAVGANVLLFKPGAEVFYAGAIGRAGSNAEYAVVDERIVGRKPRTLTFSEAALCRLPPSRHGKLCLTASSSSSASVPSMRPF
jgi:NADPH:quinone reductase-like Zn-dependent oxidoreductase